MPHKSPKDQKKIRRRKEGIQSSFCRKKGVLPGKKKDIQHEHTVKAKLNSEIGTPKQRKGGNRVTRD